MNIRIYCVFAFILASAKSDPLPFDYGPFFGDNTLTKVEGTKEEIDLSGAPLKFLDQTYDKIYVRILIGKSVLL